MLTILTKVNEDQSRSEAELGRIRTVLELHCQLLYRTFAYYCIGPDSGTGSGDGGGHTAMWDQAAFLSSNLIPKPKPKPKPKPNPYPYPYPYPYP